MEGKSVRAPFAAAIMGVLILGLVVAKIEARVVITTCCRNIIGRSCYSACRLQGNLQPVCANRCDCMEVIGFTCPPSHPRNDVLEKSDDVIEEVTTDLDAFHPFKVWCATPTAQSCFDSCSLRPEQLCVIRCGCMYLPRAIIDEEIVW